MCDKQSSCSEEKVNLDCHMDGLKLHLISLQVDIIL